MTEQTGPVPGPAVRRWTPWVLFGVAIVILVIGAWLRRHTLDDAFINYRIVDQLTAGNGPVFNAGERVEAFTSPAWLALLTVGDLLLPFRLEWIGMLGGIVVGALGLVFAGLGAHLLHRRDKHPDTVLLVPLGALVTAAFPPIYRLIATGLEDGLTIAWFGGCLWTLGRWTRSGERLGLASAVLIGLGVLVRPDLAPFVGVMLIAVLVGDRRAGRGRNLVMVVTAAAIPVASEILRMGYFGVLTPNTAIAKSASLARWGKGWHYLTDTIVPYGFWVPLVVLVVIGYVPLFARRRVDEHGRRAALVAAAYLVGAAISTLYIVRVGGDYMQTRLLLPALMGFLAPVSFVPWPRRVAPAEAGDRLPQAVRLGCAVVAVAWVVVCGVFVRTSSDKRTVLFESENAVTLADFQATFPGKIRPDVKPGGVYWVSKRLPYASARGATPIAIEYGVGKVAYSLDDDAYVFDLLGLANPIAAHEQLRVRGWPGHEKLLTQPWIAALTTAPGSAVRASSFPRPPVLQSQGQPVVLPNQGDAAGRPFADRVATARGVLGCETMQRFEASYAAPMTLRRFFSNIVRAPAHQRLVVSGEPALAAAHLCTPAERARIDAALVTARPAGS